MELNYERARSLEGQMIRYRNTQGEWVTGKVIKVTKEGMEISELSENSSGEGYGFGFFGGPFFRRPFFVPFVAVGAAFPFFWW